MKTTESGQEIQPDQRRRKLFRGVSGGVGVLMAVQAKTALGGGVCASPSAILSGNTSPRPNTGITCSGGRSPGYWKVPNHASSWGGAGAVYPTFSTTVITCSSSGMSLLSLAAMATSGTTLATAGFGSSGFTVPSSLTVAPNIWAVLAFPGSFGTNGQLLRHLAAAWLNAGLFTTAGAQYPLSRLQIIQMWDATKGGGLYYPTGVTSPSQAWSGAQVISYIQGMYDINSPDPTLCTL